LQKCLSIIYSENSILQKKIFANFCCYKPQTHDFRCIPQKWNFCCYNPQAPDFCRCYIWSQFSAIFASTNTLFSSMLWSPFLRFLTIFSENYFSLF
jgi:hypothetical protein